VEERRKAFEVIVKVVERVAFLQEEDVDL